MRASKMICMLFIIILHNKITNNFYQIYFCLMRNLSMENEEKIFALISNLFEIFHSVIYGMQA